LRKSNEEKQMMKVKTELLLKKKMVEERKERLRKED